MLAHVRLQGIFILRNIDSFFKVHVLAPLAGLEKGELLLHVLKLALRLSELKDVKNEFHLQKEGESCVVPVQGA